MVSKMCLFFTLYPRCSMYDMYGIFTIIYLHDWVILFGQMLVNIPAPWFAYGVLLLGGFKHGWIIPCGE